MTAFGQKRSFVNVFFWSTLRPGNVPAGRRSDDLSVPGHDVAAKGSHLAQPLEQDVVGYGGDDAWDPRHVELERADPVLLGVLGDLHDLRFGKDLGMEHRVDLASLVDRTAERRQMVEV